MAVDTVVVLGVVATAVAALGTEAKVAATRAAVVSARSLVGMVVATAAVARVAE